MTSTMFDSGLGWSCKDAQLNGNRKSNNPQQNGEYDEGQESVFTEKRHLEDISGVDGNSSLIWTPKDRMRTVSVAVVLCLNVGVDPPDIVKPSSCAVLQAWTDPFLVAPNAQKSGEVIANNLVKQYERWHPKARFKTCTDPTVEDLKKTCCGLRKSSKDERVLLHYNGHGVPKPTSNGEIWVFNRTYTQYIPLSLYDLQQWMGSPSIYVFDCSNAGVIVESFNKFADEQQKEYNINYQQLNYLHSDGDETKMAGPRFENCLLLAACDKDEVVPLHPDLPADLFTACLTTPIRTFLVWFVKQNPNKLSLGVEMDIIELIPGTVTDRKSVLGELNWIFTAITDTIAWNSLPHELFQRLFRHDLLVASLFRNFLLAQRIMKSYDCTPVSNPAMKPMYHHPMWNSLDMAVDQCLSQMARLHNLAPDKPLTADNYCYVNSLFFTEQLTAFQLWLKLNPKPNSTPEQLPILLQVLLSQVHRSRALDLLGQFLNLGQWAVDLALSVGIYPYMLKLLQSSARELRPFLVFIWTKILAGHYTVYQNDIARENRYFLTVLSDSNISVKHQVMSAFVIATMVRHNVEAQNALVQGGCNNPTGSLIDIACILLQDNHNRYPERCKWLLICLGNVWEHNEEVRWLATRQAMHEKLYAFLEDPLPEVRAAAVFALGTFINSVTQRNDHANEIDRNIANVIVQNVYYDSCALVRKEVLVALQWFVLIFDNMFTTLQRKKAMEENKTANDRSPCGSPSSNICISRTFGAAGKASTPPESNNIGGMHRVNSNTSLSKYSSLSFMNLASHSTTNIYSRVWQLLELYMLDPSGEVSTMATQITKEITLKVCAQRSHNHSESNIGERSVHNRTLSGGSGGGASKDVYSHAEGRLSLSAVTSPYLPSPYEPKRNMYSRDPSIKEETVAQVKSVTSNHVAETMNACRKPLVKTSFVDWCIKQFSEPCSNGRLCVCPNSEHGGSEEASNWRASLFKLYKLKSRSKLSHAHHAAPATKLKIVKQIRNVRYRRLVFHPYEKLLVACDRYAFSLWNYVPGNTRTWNNENDECAKITHLELLNTQDYPQLMLASSDGSIKVWKNILPLTFSSYAPEEHEFEFKPQLSTAFFIFEDMAEQLRCAERKQLLLFSWFHRTKTLVAGGGDNRVIRLWDAQQERKIRDMNTENEAITSLSTHKDNLIVVGGAEGTVKLYDCRLNQNTCQTFHNPASSIVNAKLWSRDDGSTHLVTGNQSGDLRWFDPRNSSKHVHFESLGARLTSMCFHENINVLACAYGEDKSDIQLFSGDAVKGPNIRAGNRKIKHLVFHPFKSQLAMIGYDSSVTIFKSPLKESRVFTL